MGRLFFLILFFFLSLSAWAGEAVTFTDYRGNSAEIEISSQFGSDQRGALIKALKFLFSIENRPSSRLHQLYFNGDVSGSTYLKWFTDRVSRIEYAYDNANVTRIAFFMPDDLLSFFGYKTKTIYLNSKFFSSTWPVKINNEFVPNFFIRISVLFHEARHSEGSLYDHVICPEVVEPYHDDPFSKRTWFGGGRGCDRSIGGPNGIALIFQYNVFRHFPVYYIPPHRITEGGRIIDANSRRELKEDWESVYLTM